MRVYIIHGYMASPTDHWFPWLKQKLEQDGVNVTVLSMPNSNEPDAQAWHEYLKQNIHAPDENTYFVGHSLGSITLLNYLSQLKDVKQIGGLVLVSGFTASLPNIRELDPFTQTVPDFKAITQMSPSRSVIVSDDDVIVAPSFTHDLAAALNVDPVIVPKGGHFMKDEGFTELPPVYELLTGFMNETPKAPVAFKYPLSIRVLHWLRAIIIIGLIASGWYMTGLPDSKMEMAEFLYPNHKQFGVLVWLLAIVHLTLRWRYRAVMPASPVALKLWEQRLSLVIHKLLITLTVLVPLLGYSMSSSYTQSDGVPFFFIGHIPELLPKNDKAFAVFQSLHAYGAYVILFCVFLHVAGALKHRFLDKNGATDVLPRML